MQLLNAVNAPASTFKGLGVSTIPLLNVAANPDVHSPLFWLNIAAALLSIVIGALSPGNKPQ